VVLRELLRRGHLHGDVPHIDGASLEAVLADAPAPDGAVVRSTEQAIRPNGGLVVLKGNLAPEGALLKTVGLKSLTFEASLGYSIAKKRVRGSSRRELTRRAPFS